ncbi:MAG: hypothetical protein V4819_14205 [Verrucomicrobiota bacterium]
MKKYHSPRGKRPAFLRLTYAFIAIAVLSACEVIIDHDGTVTQKLGLHFNNTLVDSAKARLGFGTLPAVKKHATVGLPVGMAIPENDKRMFLVDLPKGMSKEGENTSLAGKGRVILGQASQEAIMAATKVDIPAK